MGADLQSVAEPLEEEAPESGSLQLGGEPEDRDIGREGSIPQSYHNQRRPSSQAPIHRGSNGGPFGPSLTQNFPLQNIGSLSSINGRTLTAHQQNQLAMLKSTQSQGGFMDQYPPGMGNLGQGASLFQQQGHNRQSSRYNFANDGSSTSSSSKAIGESQIDGAAVFNDAVCQSRKSILWLIYARSTTGAQVYGNSTNRRHVWTRSWLWRVHGR